MHSPRRVCFWVAWLNDWSTPRRTRYVAVFDYVVCPKKMHDKIAGQQYCPTTVELKALGNESTQSSFPMPRLLQIDNRYRKIRTMPKVNVSGHTKSTPMEKWFTTDSIYISKVRSWHYESTSNILFASQTMDTCIFVGSNMLACQCFFVGQFVLYKKAEKAEKSVQPVVAVPRLGGSWHVGLEM